MTPTSRAAVSGDWSPERYATLAAFVPAFGADLLPLLAPRPGEQVLDLGCGDGVLSASIAAVGAQVTGVDASPAMVDAARARGIDARLVAAEALPYDHEFDAVFSNAMLHWTTDVERVLAGVARALRPGGRFVGEFGGAGNVRSILDAAEAIFDRHGWTFANPWYFPTPDAFEAALRRHGFESAHVSAFERPTPLPAGLSGWLEIFGRPIARQAPAGAEVMLLAEISDRLRGVEIADYVRIRFAAVRPETTGTLSPPAA